MRKITLLSLALTGVLALPQPGLAQSGRFAPAIIVNDAAVTNYELEQRIRFLTILRVPGDPVAEAEKGLVEDRLRLQAAKAAGVTLSEAQVSAGMAEFAGRANLETEQFLQAIGEGGVAPETFREFVRAGLAWRELMRARFLPRVRISEAEIDRALSVPAQRGAGPRVLLSEIIIPTTPDTALDVQELATELAGTIRSEAAFAAAAREHSAAGSRESGGQIGWVPVTNLPPQARAALAGLANGQVSQPVPLGNAIGLFRLRGIQQATEIPASAISLDYAQVLIPGGRTAPALAEASRLRGAVDTCDDLYREVKTAGAVSRETRSLAVVPSDVAGALASLDDNEVSTELTRGGALVFLMLCKRSATLVLGSEPILTDASAGAASDGRRAIDPALGFGKGPSRAQVREELTNQRLAGFADGYLAELRANAIIRLP